MYIGTQHVLRPSVIRRYYTICLNKLSLYYFIFTQKSFMYVNFKLYNVLNSRDCWLPPPWRWYILLILLTII